MEEKQVALNTNVEFCYHIPHLHLRVRISLKTNRLAATGAAEQGWSSFNKSFPENRNYLSYLVVTWENSSARLSLLKWKAAYHLPTLSFQHLP